MAGGKTKRVGPLYTRAVANIERARQVAGVNQKEVALSIGMTETTYAQKLRGVRSHFFEDEMEAIGDFFRRATGRPLTGFPHVDWQLMESIDRKVCGWKP